MQIFCSGTIGCLPIQHHHNTGITFSHLQASFRKTVVALFRILGRGDVGDSSISNWGIRRGCIYRIKGQRSLEMDKDMQRLRQVLQTHRKRHGGLALRLCSSCAPLYALLLLPLLAHSWLIYLHHFIDYVSCFFLQLIVCMY